PVCSFVLHSYVARRVLHSFPTRRSSDLADGPPWNLIVDAVGRSGEYNMAMDEALLEEVASHGGAYLRFYRWDPPTLSLGRNQPRSEEHTSELQSRFDLVCRLLLEKKKTH